MLALALHESVSNILLIFAIHVITGTIEMPRSLLPSEMTSNNTPAFVSVRALRRVEYGTRVEMEPLTTEDWELLEVHSEDMERGQLLSQVSVVYPKQILHFRVGNHGDKVKILVRDVQTVSSSLDASIWPDVVKPEGCTSNSDEWSSTPSCVLLVQNTQVIVVPKPKLVKKMPSWTPPLRLIPSNVEWGDALDVLLGISKVETFSVEPCSVLVNAEQWLHKCEWSRVKPAKTQSPERRVRVVTSAVVPLDHAGMSYVELECGLCCEHLGVHDEEVEIHILNVTNS
jgi:Peroxisome biogenesis factor 1, N-terminal